MANDKSIFLKALDAYNAYMAEHNACLFIEPEETISEIDGEYVYLANHSGLLAKYEIATGEIITD